MVFLEIIPLKEVNRSSFLFQIKIFNTKESKYIMKNWICIAVRFIVINARTQRKIIIAWSNT